MVIVTPNARTLRPIENIHFRSTPMSAISTCRAVVLTAVVATSAMAQNASLRDSSISTSAQLAQRSTVSLSLIQTRPQGAFAEHVGFGYGLNGTVLVRLDHAGILSVRADVGAATYGNQSTQTALSESVGGRVQVDVKTQNYLIPFTLGPQLSWPKGRIRPYVNIGVGGQGFITESRVQSTNGGPATARTTNHTAWAAAWGAGGGVAIPLLTGKTPIQLDLGAQYVAGGRASYLSRGSIVDLPGGAIRVTPQESSTHVLVVRLGARIGR